MNATQTYFAERNKLPYRNLETGETQSLGSWQITYPKHVFLEMYYNGDLVHVGEGGSS